MREISERLAEATAAAELLSDTWCIVRLAAEALAAACPRGTSVAFTRRLDGTYDAIAAVADRTILPLRSRPAGRVPWVVDIDNVPRWQRNDWIEPIHAGVHGPDYFANPAVPRWLDSRELPDYGRMMVCYGGRMIGWVGTYVPASRPFRSRERTALAEVCSRLAVPLHSAVLLNRGVRPIELSPRQGAIVSRVALGYTNKQIARELNVSPATVKTILERLYRASATGNRAALVDWWHSGRELPVGRQFEAEFVTISRRSSRQD